MEKLDIFQGIVLRIKDIISQGDLIQSHLRAEAEAEALAKVQAKVQARGFIIIIIYFVKII